MRDMGKLWTLITKKQTTVSSAAIMLGSMMLLSHIFGLARDRLLFSYFSPEILGVYYAAFRIPNVMFELLVTGALTVAFIPVYTKFLTAQRNDHAMRLARVLMNISMGIFTLVSIPLYIGAPWVSARLAPGFTGTEIALMSAFTRFILLFQVAPLLIGNVLTGMLQSHNLFLVPSIAPVLYNVGIMIGTVAFSPIYGLWGPVIGVALGALLFTAVQVPLAVRLGYRHGFDIHSNAPGVREVWRLMGPRTFGLAISQIDITVDLILASLLGARMVTIFNVAQHLQHVPVRLFGSTIAQAALPSLSRFSAKENREEFIATMHTAIHQILFWVLPASLLFIVLRIPVVRLVFGASQFDWAATVETGMTLSAFSISLFAQSLIHLLARGFYALYDSKTPVAIGIVTVMVNSILSVICILVLRLPVWSLGLSTSIASIANAAFLLYWLNIRMRGLVSKALIVPIIKMGVATLVTGVALYIPLKLFDQLVFDTTRTFGLMLLTGVSAAAGIGTYFFLSWVLGVTQVYALIHLTKKLRSLRGVVSEGVSDTLS